MTILAIIITFFGSILFVLLAVEWFLNDGPNTDVVFNNPTETNTQITVSEYGVYEIGLTGCGGTTFTELHFQPVAPHIIAPNFQNCVLFFEI